MTLIGLQLPIAIGLQFIIWFVDNLVANAVAVALVGFCIGPIFPNTVYGTYHWQGLR